MYEMRDTLLNTDPRALVWLYWFLGAVALPGGREKVVLEVGGDQSTATAFAASVCDTGGYFYTIAVPPACMEFALGGDWCEIGINWRKPINLLSIGVGNVIDIVTKILILFAPHVSNGGLLVVRGIPYPTLRAMIDDVLVWPWEWQCVMQLPRILAGGVVILQRTSCLDREQANQSILSVAADIEGGIAE